MVLEILNKFTRLKKKLSLAIFFSIFLITFADASLYALMKTQVPTGASYTSSGLE